MKFMDFLKPLATEHYQDFLGVEFLIKNDKAPKHILDIDISKNDETNQIDLNLEWFDYDVLENKTKETHYDTIDDVIDYLVDKCSYIFIKEVVGFERMGGHGHTYEIKLISFKDIYRETDMSEADEVKEANKFKEDYLNRKVQRLSKG